jgi:hypothetical protein
VTSAMAAEQAVAVNHWRLRALRASLPHHRRARSAADAIADCRGYDPDSIATSLRDGNIP